MNDYLNMMLSRERQHDLLREAEGQRAALEAIREQRVLNVAIAPVNHNERNDRPALVWAGRRLTALGNQLLVLAGEQN